MIVKDLMRDIGKSVSPFHTVANAAEFLTENGFVRLEETEPWKIREGGKYFVVRGGSSLVAFVVGGSAYNIVAAHTDSPSFKIKAHASTTVAQFCKLNVESYGGGIFYSWLDRKLGIAGRILVEDENSVHGVRSIVADGGITVVIPSLAIHMNRNANEGFAINAQNDMSPVIADKNVTMEELFAPRAGGKRIVDYDLYLYAKEEPYFYGVDDCLIASPRLDDLEGVYGGLYALVRADKLSDTPVLALFDNEEVGSGTKQGAGSTFLADTLRRIDVCRGRSEEQHMISLARSMMVSMDNAHGKHPNKPELNDPTNEVVLNGGIVIKHHANQNYTTDGASSAAFKNILARAGVRYQDFHMRSDLRCGGTLGAISSSQLSIASVDIGLAQWAMHSAVESAGAKDFDELVNGLKAFFEAPNELIAN